jgi:TrmH family RNA methyltransferase
VTKYIYQKKLSHSFAIGVYSTIELLSARPQDVVEVILSNRGKANTGVSKILKLAEKHRIKVIYNDNTVQWISKSDNNYAIGVFKKYESPLEQNKNHIVLVNPSNMGNMGTIIRTSLAFNCNNIAVIRPAVDYFDPKVVRGSMGAIFHLNIEYFSTFNNYRNVHGHNRSFYLFDETARKTLEEVQFEKPWSLVFGNEGEGFDSDVKRSGTLVKIPQSRNVDSLNLSVAAGIVLYTSQT